MTAFERCMEQLDEIERKIDRIAGNLSDARAAAPTPEFVWFWMFGVPIFSVLLAITVVVLFL